MRTALTVLALATVLTAALAGDNWPAFRGQNGAGHSDSTGLPVTWGEKENVVWKTAIHDKGWSSPVVWGNQVWLTTARADGKQMFVVCVDRDSGKITHDVKLFDVEDPAFCIEFNSYASPTPVIEEGRVYAHFGTYGTACLDTKTGQVLWVRRGFYCDHHRGPGSSPILHGDLLILTFDGYDQQYLAALDKKTGATVWKRDRETQFPTENGDLKKAYSTPAVFMINGKEMLISPGAEAHMAYDPKTGEEIWRVHCGGMNTAARPVYGQGKLFLTSANGGFGLFALNPDGKGDITKTNVEWKTTKGASVRTSPLLIGDYLYTVMENGIIYCIDPKTGDTVNQQRLGGNFSAAPVYAEGRIYACNQEGVCCVVEATKELKVLAKNEIEVEKGDKQGGFMASPAIAGKSLFLRSRTHLYRIEKKN